MEFAKVEELAIETAVEQGKKAAVRELELLELALVGGGLGEVVFS